jgi:hypothetical protein
VGGARARSYRGSLPISGLSLPVLVRHDRGGAELPWGALLEWPCVGGGAGRMLLQFGAKWRAGGIHYGSGGFGEAEELAREREPRGRMVMQFVSRKLSRFSNRRPVNSSYYVSGLGRLRK